MPDEARPWPWRRPFFWCYSSGRSEIGMARLGNSHRLSLRAHQFVYYRSLTTASPRKCSPWSRHPAHGDRAGRVIQTGGVDRSQTANGKTFGRVSALVKEHIYESQVYERRPAARDTRLPSLGYPMHLSVAACIGFRPGHAAGQRSRAGELRPVERHVIRKLLRRQTAQGGVRSAAGPSRGAETPA